MTPGSIQNVVKAVFSLPGDGVPYKKTVITLKGDFYQAESFTSTQAFHKNLRPEELAGHMDSLFPDRFSQCVVWDGEKEYSFRRTASGKMLTNRRAFAMAGGEKGHDRKKNYLIEEGENIPALVDMGVFTKEGRVAAPMRRKYRQINRFLEIVDDSVSRMPDAKISVVDFGCGKSYLTFILYYYLTVKKNFQADIVGLDLKKDVIEKCSQTARRYGYDGLRFEVGDIASFKGEKPDMVVTLHACDTATDYALYNAVKWGTELIFSVPCCQHEANAQFKTEELRALSRWGILQERTAALVTDAVRAEMLVSCGYRTQVMEFIETEHTPKNLLIRAVKGGVSEKERERALAEAQRLQTAFGLDLTLPRLLKEKEEK